MAWRTWPSLERAINLLEEFAAEVLEQRRRYGREVRQMIRRSDVSDAEGPPSESDEPDEPDELVRFDEWDRFVVTR
ncbi:hypothetical protein VI06_13850 [Aquitalea magnusonii]|nr:hypothetical protein VI06_13850 [Aquitalea magnusonii]